MLSRLRNSNKSSANIDRIAERISAYADGLNRIDTLGDRITLREATLEALNDNIAQLDEKREDRLEELSQLSKKVGVLKKADGRVTPGIQELKTSIKSRSPVAPVDLQWSCYQKPTCIDAPCSY